MSRNSIPAVIITILILIPLVGCELFYDEPTPSGFRTQTPVRSSNYPTFTRINTQSPAGTNTRTPTQTRTSSPTPLPTYTPMPLPSAVELKNKFTAEVNPFVMKLLAALEDSSKAITSEHEIIYVPQTEPLHYIQSILHLTRNPASSSSKKAYVLYSYSRGADLGKSSLGLPVFSATTEAVTATLRLLVEEDGKLFLVEKKEATGGSGASSYRNLVERAITPFDKLEANLKTAVENTLQEIIGYACGIDMTSGFDFHRRVAVLVYSLGSSNWSDRRQAGEALGSMSPLPFSAAPALFAKLTDTNSGVSTAAKSALTKMADNIEVFNLLVTETKNSNAKVREQLALIFGSITSPGITAQIPLLELLKDTDIFVRRAAAAGLGSLAKFLGGEQGAAVIAELIIALKDKDSLVREVAANSIGSYGSAASSAVSALIALLQDSTAKVREHAASALGSIGIASKGALPDLIKAAQKETDGPAYKSEIEAIASLSSKTETLPLLKEALSRTQVVIRSTVCELLGKYQNIEGAVDLLIFTLSDKDATIRRDAALALATLKSGIKSAVPALIIALGDNVSTVRIEAAKTLAVIGVDAATAVPALIKMVETEPTNGKDDAINALGKIGSAAKAAVPVLIQFLNSSDTTLSSACTTALKAITKVDFGKDLQKWMVWWEENKDK